MQARARLLASALLLGGFIIQFDHYAIGVTDEDLPRLATRNLAGIERHPLGLEALLHALEIAAGGGHVGDQARIGGFSVSCRRKIPPTQLRADLAMPAPPQEIAGW